MPNKSPVGKPEMLTLAGAVVIAGGSQSPDARPGPEAGTVVWSRARCSQNKLIQGSYVQLWLKPLV